MNASQYFENHVSNRDKAAVASALNRLGLVRPLAEEADLAAQGAAERITQAKAACAERRRRREEKRIQHETHKSNP